jgi:hypothetical protein
VKRLEIARARRRQVRGHVGDGPWPCGERRRRRRRPGRGDHRLHRHRHRLGHRRRRRHRHRRRYRLGCGCRRGGVWEWDRALGRSSGSGHTRLPARTLQLRRKVGFEGCDTPPPPSQSDRVKEVGRVCVCVCVCAAGEIRTFHQFFVEGPHVGRDDLLVHRDAPTDNLDLFN